MVDDAQAGGQFTRADFPAAPLPTFIPTPGPGEVIDAAFVGGTEGRFTSNEALRDVTIAVDAFFAPASFGRLDVFEGLTLGSGGSLSVAPEGSGTAYLEFNGAQSVTGEGVLRLDAHSNSSSTAYAYLVSQSPEREVLEFGPDLAIEGAGRIATNRAEDRVQILGPVTAEGGELDLVRLDNAGETLSLATAADGRIDLEALVSDAVIAIAAGADVRLIGDLEDVEVAGPGRLVASGSGTRTATDLTVRAGGEAIALSDTTGSPALRLLGETVVEGRLAAAGLPSRSATLEFEGARTVSGSGTIFLSRENLLAEQSTLNYLGFDGLLSEAEVLELGAGLTLAGDGLVYAYDANDTIRLLGTVEGVAGGRLELNDLDNAGAAFAVDASEGQVVLGDRIRAVRIEAADGQTGAIGIESSTDLEDVALAIDARLSGSGSTTAYVQGGLTLDDATLSVEASENRTVTLEFEGTQTLDGEGTVLLSAAGAPEGASVTNQLAFDGLSSAAETLVIGEDITLAGHGLVYAYDSGDTIRLRGTAQGTSDGTLVLSDEVDLTSAGFELGQGLVQVRNDLVLGADNNVSLQLVSNEEGDASLDVKGTLTQGGTLSLVIAETFDAEIGDTFEFATAESVGGAFDSFSGFDLDGDRALALRQDSNRLFLEVVTDDEASQFITDDVMLS